MGISKVQDKLAKLNNEWIAAKATVDKLAKAKREIIDEAADEAVGELVKAFDDVAKLFRSGVVKKKFGILMDEIETIHSLDPNYLQRLGNSPFAYDILSKTQPGSTLLKFMAEVCRKEQEEDNSFVG
jgi:hypothetical protein